MRAATLLERIGKKVMEFAWTFVASAGVVVGVLIMISGFRKKEQKSASFGDIDGVLKQDWTRSGNIDFHAAALESRSPQLLVFRVEEKKITQNMMGQDIVQLRWRLASLDEAKEVVACWNRAKSA